MVQTSSACARRPDFVILLAGLPQLLHQLKLELKIVQALRHPNVVDFIGTIAYFPEAGQNPSDWAIGTCFEFWCGRPHAPHLLPRSCTPTWPHAPTMILISNGLVDGITLAAKEGSSTSCCTRKRSSSPSKRNSA